MKKCPLLKNNHKTQWDYKSNQTRIVNISWLKSFFKKTVPQELLIRQSTNCKCLQEDETLTFIKTCLGNNQKTYLLHHLYPHPHLDLDSVEDQDLQQNPYQDLCEGPHPHQLIYMKKKKKNAKIRQFMSSKDIDEIRVIHSKSNNIEIMNGNQTDGIIEKIIQALRLRYQMSLEESVKGCDFAIGHVVEMHHKCQKRSLKCDV